MKNKIINFFYATLLVAACGSDRNSTFSIAGYNCDSLEQVELEDPLKEISGLAYDVRRNTFLAINDEQGKIFVLDPITFRIKNKITFEDEGDYEEIQLLNNTLFVLRSDGTIYKMNYDGNEISDIRTFDYKGTKTEFESFYLTPTDNKLVLIPKDSKESKNNKATEGYVVDVITGKFISQQGFKIDWRQLKHSTAIHPSAAAIHPITKEIYILASIEKVLLVLDTSGNIHAGYPLPASIFQQPEGITFDGSGNLYISNEAGGLSPTIIKIPIQTK